MTAKKPVSNFTYDKNSEFNKSSKQQAILEQAAKKAFDNGWGDRSWWGYAKKENLLKKWLLDGTYYNVIFSHDFAKALWGEEEQPFSMVNLVRDTSQDSFTDFKEEDEKHTYYLPKWKVMLQQMIIAEDPIDYLGQNI